MAWVARLGSCVVEGEKAGSGRCGLGVGAPLSLPSRPMEPASVSGLREKKGSGGQWRGSEQEKGRERVAGHYRRGCDLR